MKANESHCSACGGTMINQSTCLQCKRSARIYDNYLKEKQQLKEKELSISHLLSVLALPASIILLTIFLWMTFTVIGVRTLSHTSHRFHQTSQEPWDAP